MERADLVENGIDFLAVFIQQANDQVRFAIVRDFEVGQARVEIELFRSLAAGTLNVMSLPAADRRSTGRLLRLLRILLLGVCDVIAAHAAGRHDQQADARADDGSADGERRTTFP